MTTIEKLDKIRDKHPWSMHITIYGDGKARIWLHNGVQQPFYALTLEEAVNEAYAAAYPVRKVEVGEIVLARTRTSGYRILRRVSPDSNGYEYTDGDLRAKATSLSNVTIIGKAYDEPIPVESAE